MRGDCSGAHRSAACPPPPPGAWEVGERAGWAATATAPGLQPLVRDPYPAGKHASSFRAWTSLWNMLRMGRGPGDGRRYVRVSPPHRGGGAVLSQIRNLLMRSLLSMRCQFGNLQSAISCEVRIAATRSDTAAMRTSIMHLLRAIRSSLSRSYGVWAMLFLIALVLITLDRATQR